MRLLVDTHVLVWLLVGDQRLRPAWLAALADPDHSFLISAVTAFEYADLVQRGRLPFEKGLAEIDELFGFPILDFPAEAAHIIGALPDIHRDPIDRMLIAHAIAFDLTLVTADETMRRYPVKSLW